MSELSDRPASSGYDSAAVIGGAIATVFFPLISLIAALLLQSGQPDPVKRKQLRTWAWVSVGWIAVQAFFVILAIGAFWSHAGPIHPVP